MTLVPARLSPRTRQQAMDAMADTELDVLVVGAGVVGAGAALDAVTRGLKVGLVEAYDYASGTSSRSSKLVHGGLRYLKQANLRLVFEALKERSLILDELAPHLAKPVEFIYPLEKRVIDRAWAGTGIGLYNMLGAGKGVPRGHRHFGKRKTRAAFPGYKRGGVHGGVSFYEGQLDDARHTMSLARTAASYGALCASSARVVGFLREGDRVVGARVQDLETGREIEVRAKRVINATGVWTDEIQRMLGGEGKFRVTASKGVHIVVPRECIDSQVGLITETKTSLLFVIPCPWSANHWVIGTTDTGWNLDLAHPAASAQDIDYILAQVNKLLDKPVTRDDIVGVYAGLRPLLAGKSDETSKLSREHSVLAPAEGLVVIAGGKYTTYRVMAKDAVDIAMTGIAVEPSRTEKIPLVGAHQYRELWTARARLAREHNLDVTTIEHLLNRHGGMITEVLELVDADRSLAQPVSGDYLGAEIVYAVTHEGALHLEDILTRRTHISIETVDRGSAGADKAARLVAPLLGWDRSQIAREVARYRTRVDAEIESQRQPDDAAANATRIGAPDSREIARTTLAHA